MPFESFPDVQVMVMDALGSFGTVALQTPSDLENHVPFITVQRTGGTDNRFSDTASVTVQVFTKTYSGMALAESIRQTLISAPTSTALGVIDRVTTDMAPVEVPWTDGATIRRFTASYRVRLRR